MHKKYFTLAEIAEMTGSELIGDPDYLISNVSDLQTAEAEDASFLSNPRYEKAMHLSNAGVIFIAKSIMAIEGKNFLVHSNPTVAFQTVLEAFFEATHMLTGFSGAHSSAVIHEKSSIGKNVTIGPNAVIDQDARIGDNTFIGAGSYIGAGVTIGDNTLIHPNVTIRELCQIGNKVVIHPGVVIGSCGFGFTTNSDGTHEKLCQVGIVIIEDDVEIGANSTIDRSRFKATIISKGTKIDNLVQIGHGVAIGQNNIIVSQTGIAGSTKLGDNVVIGGQVGIAGHITITDNVAIAAKSGVSKSIKKPGNYRGIPILPFDEYNRKYVHFKKLDKLYKRIDRLELNLEAIKEPSTQ